MSWKSIQVCMHVTRYFEDAFAIMALGAVFISLYFSSLLLIQLNSLLYDMHSNSSRLVLGFVMIWFNDNNLHLIYLEGCTLICYS